MTEKEASYLRPGDKIKVINCNSVDLEQGFYNGQILTVGYPTILENDSKKRAIHIRYNSPKYEFEHKWVIAFENAETIKMCNCPITLLIVRGCICGGI